MSDFADQIAKMVEDKDPEFQVGSLLFYGWTNRPSDNQQVGVFKEDIYGNGGCMTLDGWKKAASGEEITAANGKDEAMAIEFAQKVVNSAPAAAM